jgi:hypothetical protein
MFVILVSYRARGIQVFRRSQVIALMSNIDIYFNKYNIEYKIIICEQDDNNLFNRGMLLNIAFLESEKIYKNHNNIIYMHMNTDYLFDLNRVFPDEFINFNSGFIDIHRPPYPVLGAACIFDAKSYLEINGFPNDLCGWGGDDWAIYNRIIKKQIPLLTPHGLFNSGFIIEINERFNNDTSQNNKNVELAHRNDLELNGLNNCCYRINSYGEFNNKNVFHLIVSLI